VCLDLLQNTVQSNLFHFFQRAISAYFMIDKFDNISSRDKILESSSLKLFSYSKVQPYDEHSARKFKQ